MKTFKKILSLKLAVAILISTTGFTLHEHKCTHTGTVIVSFVEDHENCCANDNEENSNNCCENSMSCSLESPTHCCNVSLKTFKLASPFIYPEKKVLKDHGLQKVAEQRSRTVRACKTAVHIEFGNDFQTLLEHYPPIYILYNQLKIMTSC